MVFFFFFCAQVLKHIYIWFFYITIFFPCFCSQVPDRVADAAEALCERALKECAKIGRSLRKSRAADVPLLTTFEQCVARLQAGDKKFARIDLAMVRQCLRHEVEQEYATPVQFMSTKYFDEDDEFDGEDGLVTDGGLGRVATHLARGLDVRLGCEVTAVTVHGPDAKTGVRGTGRGRGGGHGCNGDGDGDGDGGSSSSSSSSSSYSSSSSSSSVSESAAQQQQIRPGAGDEGPVHVAVSFRDAGAAHAGGAVSTLTARCCIVTVPLGVLKAGTIAFSPALPGPKTAAIQNLGFGLMNKVFLEFNKPFWPKKMPMLSVFTEDEERSLLFVPVALGRGHDHRAVLAAFATGHQAERIERLSDAEVVAATMAEIRSVLPRAGVPEPIAFAISRWRSDPFARGSYSHMAVGASTASYADLAAPVGTALHFAGEATHARFPSTVHGAFLSGRRAAREVISLLQ
jgi:hypothetical protein